MTKDQILALDGKKHIKIWLLHKLGMSRKEIAEALKTNAGHVGNEIKAYEKSGLKQMEAEKLTNKTENGKEEKTKGEIIHEAISYISRGVSAAKEKQSGGISKEELSNIENKLAVEFATKNKLLIDGIASLPAPIGGGGNENMLYYDDGSGIIYKQNNLFNCNNSILKFLEYVCAHNKLFPSTEYNLVGFIGQRSINPVISQKYILGNQASPSEIQSYMEALGFEKLNDHTYTNKSYTVADLRERNVIKGDDGEIYVIDNVISEVKKAAEGLLVGASHADGGIDIKTPEGKIEAEGGEAIINKEATAKNLELFSKINQSAGNGVAFTKDDKEAAREQAKKVTAAYGGRVASKNTENVKWFKDKQGRDRFEIDDSGAIFDYDILLLSAKASSEQNKVIVLEVGNILKEWDGYKYYPEIRELKVVFSPNYSPLDFIFAYEQIQDSIYINSNNFYYDENNKRGADKKALRNDEGGAKGVEQGPSGANPAPRRMDSRSRFLHEIQHALQKREGINISVSDWDSLLWLKDKTGNGQMSDNDFIEWIEDKTKAPYKNFLYSYYLTIDSEIEAHDVQNRSNLSKDDREAIAPIIKAKHGALTTGTKIEAEHENLYNELAKRLESEGSKMPMSKKEFFTKIAKEHISETPDYYSKLQKYVEPSKPYYLLEKDEVISERDRLEKTGENPQRLQDLCRYSYTKFKTLLKDLK